MPEIFEIDWLFCEYVLFNLIICHINYNWVKYDLRYGQYFQYFDILWLEMLFIL